MLVSSLSTINPSTTSMMDTIQDPKSLVTIDIQPDPVSPEMVIESLVAIEGPLDVYTWYEGPMNLPASGAEFLRENLFEPLYKQKSEAKLFLYSLKVCWTLDADLSRMPSKTTLGQEINKINQAAIECIYASAFFNYCTQFSADDPLYLFINEELPKKQWLAALSADKPEKKLTIGELFNKKISLADCIKTENLGQSYSKLQYLEGYYLIREAFIRGREAFKRGLDQEEQKINVAFVLPNDEAKYYQDYPQDIEEMLKAEFGEKEMEGFEVNIYFRFYNYLSTDSRPYIEKQSQGGPKVKVVAKKEIRSYFNYLQNIKG